MSGTPLKRNQIAINLYVNIGKFLEGKNCQILPSEMRVSTPNRDSYMYPDATILCNEPVLEDEHFDTLKNPSVVFEILSPSTQKYDMGYKLLFYQQIPSLKEYIMIDPTSRFVQLVRKQPDGDWRFENILTGVVNIETIDFEISFDQIYHNTGL
jgi:Uma2 family endonuclease